jgi:glutamate formiminotransferase
MLPVLEAVPNFSVGRDQAFLDCLVRAATEAGAEVLDLSADPDHNRAVLTYIGAPRAVEDASVAVARLALEEIDLRVHRGVHPRVGALDVLPFVPLNGLSLDDARTVARRVGRRLTDEVGLPVYFYGEASDPPGRRLADLRRGGFEALLDAFPEGRVPDLLPDPWGHPGAHPTAGVICVGARPLLLAWNVEVEGLSEEDLHRIAARLRETGGGYYGLRALGFVRRGGARMQISMNLEDVRHRPFPHIFQEVEERVRDAGGVVRATEIVGMIPDSILLEAGADRISLLNPDPHRILSSRLAEHLARRIEGEVRSLVAVVRGAGDRAPLEVQKATNRLESALLDELLEETP